MYKRQGLAWTTNTEASARDTNASWPRLPGASLSVLQELGEMGYVRGILEKLDELDQLDTAYAPITHALRSCVQRFDLQGYVRALEEVKG